MEANFFWKAKDLDWTGTAHGMTAKAMHLELVAIRNMTSKRWRLMIVGSERKIVAESLRNESEVKEAANEWLTKELIKTLRRTKLGCTHQLIRDDASDDALDLLDHLKPGDIITHKRCMNVIQEHVFIEWHQSDGMITARPTADTSLLEGTWQEVSDIHPQNITHINRCPIEALSVQAAAPKSHYALNN